MASMFRSRLAFASLIVSVLAAACGLDAEGNEDDCPRGAEDCRCKSDDTCDTGLFCDDDDHCSAAGGSAGKGGAGAGSAGKVGGTSNGGTSGEAASGAGAGKSGGSGRNGLGGDPVDGGRGGSSAGDMGEPDAGGEGGREEGEGGVSGRSGSSGAGNGGGAGDSGSGGSSAGTGGSGGAAGSGGSSGKACAPLTVENPTPNLSVSTAAYVYSATLAAPLDTTGLFALEFFDGASYDGAATGTFTIGAGADANYKTCSRCLHVTVGGTRHFLGSAGTLTLAADSDQLHGTVHGSITNATLIEVTIDTSDFESTPVQGGACLTLGSLALDIEPEPNPDLPPGWTCPDHWYGDGECDCGCGAADNNCADASFDSCDFCWCGGAGSNCNAPDPGIDPNDNSQCLHTAEGT